MEKLFTEDTLARDATRYQFWRDFDNACRAAGGGSRKSLENLPFKEVVDIMAHNGVRMTYDPLWHMDRMSKHFPSDMIAVALEKLNTLHEQLPPE